MVWDVVGQDMVISLLQRGLETGSLSHAYLVVGPAHVGKMTLAFNLAQALNCKGEAPPCGECDSCRRIAEGKHSDIQVIDLASSDGGSTDSESKAKISVEQIEQIQRAAYLPPFEGKCKVFILDGAEFLSIGAANRLLKTLEEPTENVVFIIITVDEKLLPATIISRCQRLEMAPIGAAEVEHTLIERWTIEPEKARLLSRLAGGCLGWAINAARNGQFLQQRDESLDGIIDIAEAGYERRFQYASQLAGRFNQSRESVQEVLRLWLDWWRDLLLVKVGCRDAITNIDRLTQLDETASEYTLIQMRKFIDNIREAGEQLRFNANPLLVLEVLILSIPDNGIKKSTVPGQR